MLILSRRIGEKILLGNDIEVIVLDLQANQCKLGIKAPRDTTILREELVHKPRNEQDAVEKVE